MELMELRLKFFFLLFQYYFAFYVIEIIKSFDLARTLDRWNIFDIFHSVYQNICLTECYWYFFGVYQKIVSIVLLFVNIL